MNKQWECTTNNIYDFFLRLSRDDVTLTNIYCVGDIGDKGAMILAQGLENNMTVKTIEFKNNNIGNLGMEKLRDPLSVNTTLTHFTFIDLEERKTGSLSVSFGGVLQENETLTSLTLISDGINDRTALQLVLSLDMNYTLTDLYLSSTNIRHMAMIAHTLLLTDHESLTSVFLKGRSPVPEKEMNEIKTMTRLNGAICHPLSNCNPNNLHEWEKYNLLFLLFILRELPVVDDIHWEILGMVKVRDLRLDRFVTIS